MVAPDFDRTTVRIGMAVPIAASAYLAAGTLGIEIPGFVAALSGIDESLTDVLPSLTKMSVALALQSATAAEIELARHLLLVAIFSSFATLVVQGARAPYATVDIDDFRRRCVGAAHGVGSAKTVVACTSLSLLIGWVVLLFLGFGPHFSPLFGYLGMFAVTPVICAAIWFTFSSELLS